MTTIFSEDIEVSINGKKLINESHIVINSNTKYCVIGNNGCGKTTLMKYLFSKLEPITDILMIDQDIIIDSTEQTVSDFILNADPDLYQQYKKLVILESSDLTDIQQEEYNKLSEYVYNISSWDKYFSESKKILHGLGFDNNLDKPVSILSGGWRIRLALGKALLRLPTVLVLDEPSNHLDLNAVIWLSDYLTNYKKTLIVITHQIDLVETIADITWFVGNPELTGTKIYTVSGGYYSYIQMLEQLSTEVFNKYEKFQKKIEEMKKKSIPKKKVEEFIKINNVLRPPKQYIVNIEFENVLAPFTKNIIDFKNIKFGYDNNIIFDNLNFTIQMGCRYILVGQNGVGKTTLFKLAYASMKPQEGYVIKDERLRIGYYHQQMVDNLPLDMTPIEYLQSIDSTLDLTQCRRILGKLGIKKKDIMDLPTSIISTLSGGEKARVSLASIQMFSPQLILMDEPTNHLDLESINGLIKGINEFNGALVIITHDMYLIKSIKEATIYETENRNIKKFKGSFEKYCDYILK
jgi:ATP-binding cassette subfamily F protein 1